MPRKSETQRSLDLIMDEALYERIEQLAKEEGKSKGAIVREILGEKFGVKPTVKDWRVGRADRQPA